MNNAGGFSGNSGFNNSQNSSGNIPSISSLNLDNNSSPAEGSNAQNNNVQLQNFASPFPPNFDLNSLSPAERDLLLRRLQQHQQQQFQLQRARQQQLQQAQAQRMTMNAYSTPRPPLSGANSSNLSANPINNGQYFVNPINQMPNMMMGYQHNYLARPVMGATNGYSMNQSGINPALLQNQQQQHQHGIKQINPQQFTNPLANVPMKSDPVLYTVPSGNNTSQFAQSQQSQSPIIPPFDDQVLNSEGNFIEHLIKFYDAIKYNNRVVPQLNNRPISLYRLFTVVTSLGGFSKVGETKKWPIVTHSLQLPANSYEIVSTVRATYYSFLYPYEQYFLQKKPLEKIDWPNQPKTHSTPTSTSSVPTNNPPVATGTSTSYNVNTANTNTNANTIPSKSTPSANPVVPTFNPQLLKYIPESELSLWKHFSEGLRVPITPINDLETAVLYLNSPYFILKIEALLTTQRLFAQSTLKDLQSAGFSTTFLANLLESLEHLWKQSVKSIPRRNQNCHKTMETFWTEKDNQMHQVLEVENDDLSCKKRDELICRLITNLIRTITVTRGPEINQVISQSSFVNSISLPFALMECEDFEIYKNCLVIFEAISSHLTDSKTTSVLLEWQVVQCQLELSQCRIERLTSIVSKLTGILNLQRVSNFDNLVTARQTVSALITQCAQLWKSVPGHVFLHLSSVLNLLTCLNDPFNFDLKSLVLEIEKFMDLFVLPIVTLLRSIRALFECTNSFSNSQDEIRRILETVIYSSNFSLTDGGFLEICLQILIKCQDNQMECFEQFNWTGIVLLLRELREFWRHSASEGITNLGKVCYQTINAPSSNGSPGKRITNPSNPNRISLSIINNTSNLPAIFSHPFGLLHKSLSLLTNSFHSLPDSIKLDLLELAVEWNLETPTKWGKEVLGSEKIEESLKILREFYF